MLDLDAKIKALLLGVPNARIFSKPMSKKARILLNEIITWGVEKSGTCFKKVPNPSIECIKTFLIEYKPIIFEDACHRFDMSKYITLVKSTYKPHTVEGLIDVMMLRNLQNETWVQNNGLQLNSARIGSILVDRTTELYDWLTTYYVMTDFTESDLNKISSLSGEEYSLQVIKDEANSISDTDKRNISYLYAIVRDVTSRAAVVRDQERIIGSKYEERLKSIFDYSGPKIQHENPDKTAEWKREREWLNALLDLEKND